MITIIITNNDNKSILNGQKRELPLLCGRYKWALYLHVYCMYIYRKAAFKRILIDALKIGLIEISVT